MRKFGINVIKIPNGDWSIGIDFEHQWNGRAEGYETYFVIAIVKWIIFIGYIV